MGRRSYSPSPPPRGGYGRRRSPSPRGRYGGGGGSRGRDLPTSLLVRNLRRDCRAEDLRRPFGQFGPLKDIYLPRDYYSGFVEGGVYDIEDFKISSLEDFQLIFIPTNLREPRGFGFVQFVDPADAAEAKYQMDGQVLQGRQMTVVFAEENRKKPDDMRFRERSRGGGSRFSDRRRSPPRRYSRSPPPRYARSPSRGREYSPPPKRRQYSRSISPRDKRYSRERSYSGSPVRGRSPSSDEPPRSPSRSPVKERSPPYSEPRSRSPSRSPVRSPSRSRSRSGEPGDYYRDVPQRSDGSASP
ncbi:putative RNA recognition motif domain, nucleotide-binding alpha-beta plait domain superfamily [Helianthus annuus]|nr:putative RNA recognition motif domain, nucleotide-binding alpha-beta plait domain superfamily [Helianthus annuus]